ncbi:hypothetical protein PPYR_12531 [Photinus pyralis]|uniref:Protein sleepless n=1 Tax=Photinus pyralis TaxID=7054 RepID=A0A1Y1LHT3_PHOPY|nr:uncharacterized protein LOC116178943 [Photinus pyralis]KAB0792911.1 hypothetical protein PPYR_12531 [Photinus pyralis]
MNPSVICGILSFFCVVQLGYTKQCYSCAGTPIDMPHIPNLPPQIKVMSKACSDPIKINELSNAKVNCDDGISQCTKMEMKVGDIEIVMRGCLPPEGCAVFKDCHTCTGDLCNSSAVILPSLLFVTFVSLLVAKVNW